MLGRWDSHEDQKLQFIVDLYLQILNMSKYVEYGKYTGKKHPKQPTSTNRNKKNLLVI